MPCSKYFVKEGISESQIDRSRNAIYYLLLAYPYFSSIIIHTKQHYIIRILYVEYTLHFLYFAITLEHSPIRCFFAKKDYIYAQDVIRHVFLSRSIIATSEGVGYCQNISDQGDFKFILLTRFAAHYGIIPIQKKIWT